MSSEPPGGSASPAVFLDNHIAPYLSPSSKFLLNSLHQLSPIHKEILDNLEQEIISMHAQFLNDPEINSEITELKQKFIAIKKRKITYSMTDYGPFVVIVESKTRNIGNLHPMDLGKLLHSLNIKGILEINRKGSNRIGIKFATAMEANEFLVNKRFLEKGYVSFVPQRLLTCRGIIRDVGLSVTMDDIINETLSKVKIIQARRLNRRIREDDEIKYIPSRTVQVTFEGKQLPKEIKIFSMKLNVDPYVPPVQQCLNCLRFGHSKRQCRGKFRCPGCGADHTECLENPKCINCNGDHLATNKICKEFERQKNINEAMAFQDLSYYEASQLFPPLISRQPPRIRRPQDFPTRLDTSQSTPNQSRTVSWVKRRKSTIVEAPKQGYDRQAHREALFPPLSRSPSSSQPTKDSYSTRNTNDNTSEFAMDMQSFRDTPMDIQPHLEQTNNNAKTSEPFYSKLNSSVAHQPKLSLPKTNQT